MKTALFKEILALLKTLGIKVDIGMRTNIEKIPSMQSLANTTLSKTRMKKEIDRVGLEKVISIFKEEARYLPALNDKEAGQFLQNTKKLKEIMKPDEATIIPFVGKTEEAAVSGQIKRGTKIWEALGLDPTKDADMGQYLKISNRMSEQGLDIDNIGDVIKFTRGDIWGPTLEKESTRGIGSMFKEQKSDIADVGSLTDDLAKDSESLLGSVNKIRDLAQKMTPEYQAMEQANRQALIRMMNEGKGFDRSKEGYFRAVVRPFLINQHEKGLIQLNDDVYRSLKESLDLTSGGFFDKKFPDPVRVFRYHFGDNAFDLIPPDMPSPATRDILEEFARGDHAINAINKTSPDRPVGYLTANEIRGRILDRKDLIKVIKENEGRFSSMSQEEKLAEIAQANKTIDGWKAEFKQYYPDQTIGDETFDELLKMDPDRTKNAAGGRVSFRVGGAVWKAFLEFIEGLFIKASNDIRLGKGLFKGLPDKQKWAQHDNLTKMVDQWQKTKTLPEGAEQYFGIDPYIAFGKSRGIKITKNAKTKNTEGITYTKTETTPTSKTTTESSGDMLFRAPPEVKTHKGPRPDIEEASARTGKVFDPQTDQYVEPKLVSDKVLAKAYDEVFFQKPSSGDYKYDADVLSDSIAEQLGKESLADFPQDQQTEIYNTALKRVYADLEMNRTLKQVEEKMILSDFDPTDRKPNTFGGGVGSMFRRV
jgi:hypothetical protein